MNDDNLDILSKAVYGRRGTVRDWLGGSDALILADAAKRIADLESRLSALQQSHDRLLGALKKAVICDTCEGSKELECPPCCNCYGELQCTHTGETIDCPACNGTGLNDMPDAIAAIAEATPE